MGNEVTIIPNHQRIREEEEKRKIIRERNRLEDANRRLHQELELEKARMEKNEKIELAKLELRKQEVEKLYELRTLAKKQDGEETVQKFEMVAVTKMMELGFDPFDINIILTGISRTLRDDKTISDKRFLEDVVRNKMTLHQHLALPSSASSGAATSTSNSQSVALIRSKVEEDFNELMNYLLGSN